MTLMACGSDDSAANISGVQCAEDLDCPGSTECRDGLCVLNPGRPDGSAPQELNLRLRPPTFRSDLIEQQALDVPVSAESTLPDFLLSRPVRVLGSITYTGNTQNSGAVVRWRRTDGIPGLEYSANTTTVSSNGTFGLELPAGYYDVTIIPQFATMPRYTLRNILLNDSGASACPSDPTAFCQLWSYALQAPGDHILLPGSVSRVRDGIPEAAQNVVVYAVNTERTITTAESFTDEDGTFNVYLPPQDDTWTFYARPPDEWVPGVTVTFDQVPVLRASPPESISLALNFLAEPRQVTLNASIPGQSPRNDALFLIQGTDDPGVTTSSPTAPAPLSVRTNLRVATSASVTDGTVNVRMIPGDYQALATSPSGFFGSSNVLNFPVPTASAGPAPELISLELQPLRTFSGTVTGDVFERPVADANISFLTADGQRDPDSESGSPQAPQGFSASTDSSGAFSVDLPAGSYLARIEPPSSAGLAPAVFPLDVPADGAVDAVLRLPPSILVTGRIFAPDGSPLAGASIEAWPDDAESSLLEPLARGTSDDRGQYRLIVPAPQ
jgi:hypothetical protein